MPQPSALDFAARHSPQPSHGSGGLALTPIGAESPISRRKLGAHRDPFFGADGPRRVATASAAAGSGIGLLCSGGFELDQSVLSSSMDTSALISPYRLSAAPFLFRRRRPRRIQALASIRGQRLPLVSRHRLHAVVFAPGWSWLDALGPCSIGRVMAELRRSPIYISSSPRSHGTDSASLDAPATSVGFAKISCFIAFGF